MKKLFLQLGTIVLLLSANLSLLQAQTIIQYWTQGVATTVVDGKRDAEAGWVYASDRLLAEADINAAKGEFKAEPMMLEGEIGTSAINAVWYYYAKPADGYEFKGFVSSISGVPSGNMAADQLSKVGDFYYCSAKAGSGYSANTQEKPKMAQRYAVFAKTQSAVETMDVDGLPTYPNIVSNPEEGATISALHRLSLSVSGGDYAAPIGVLPGLQTVMVTKTVKGVKEELKYSIQPSYGNGQIHLVFEPAIADTCDVEVNIPAGLTNNLLKPVTTMSKDELIAASFCTTPALTVHYHVCPSTVKISRIVNTMDVELRNAKLWWMEKDTVFSGNEVTCILVQYERALKYAIPSKQFAEKVSVINETTGTVLDLDAYSCELGRMVLVEELGKNMRDSTYINIRLSGSNRIDNKTMLGEYHVIIQPGLGFDEDGLMTEGADFYFSFAEKTETALSNIELNKAVYKTIRDGQLVIVREGMTYTMTGSAIR